MEYVVKDYISRELVSKPDMLPLRDDTSLLISGVLDSLSVLRLVLFLENEFGVAVEPGDLIPENFESVDAICQYLHRLQELQKEQV